MCRHCPWHLIARRFGRACPKMMRQLCTLSTVRACVYICVHLDTGIGPMRAQTSPSVSLRLQVHLSTCCHHYASNQSVRRSDRGRDRSLLAVWLCLTSFVACVRACARVRLACGYACARHVLSKITLVPRTHRQDYGLATKSTSTMMRTMMTHRTVH